MACFGCPATPVSHSILPWWFFCVVVGVAALLALLLSLVELILSQLLGTKLRGPSDPEELVVLPNQEVTVQGSFR